MEKVVKLPSGMVVRLRAPGGLDAFLFYGGLKRLGKQSQKEATEETPQSGMMGPSRLYDEEAEQEPEEVEVRRAMLAQAQRICDLCLEPKLTMEYPPLGDAMNINDAFRTAEDYAAVCKAVNEMVEEAEGIVRPLSQTTARSSRSTLSERGTEGRRRRGFQS